MSELESLLAEEILRVLEFHRWSGAAEGVTAGGTVYDYRKSDLRQDVHKLQSLCRRVTSSLGGNAPPEVETLMAGGSMYRRSADYVKAQEYFLRLLELVQREVRCAR
jgi:hypothetical protein